jgi:AcrR family transcriptional regulator
MRFPSATSPELGLNEASLYNHFENKAELLAAIFRRLDERLINPGFADLPPDMFEGDARST